MHRGALLATLLLSGCFSPDPKEGLPCTEDGSCPDGQGCDLLSMTCSVNPRLACDAPTTQCGNACANLANDPLHCGDCDVQCLAGQVCSNGTCAEECGPGLMLCGQTCVDTLTDDGYCGNCGTSCGADEECRSGSCEVRCEVGLVGIPEDDQRGAYWDGLERDPKPLDVAETDCASFGARLPTATEVFRASSDQTGDVGSTASTNLLWTKAPFDATNQVVMALSNGIAQNELTGTSMPYRCICPETQFQGFVGTNCYGAPGDECDEIGDGYNIDAADRPALRKSSAIWECEFDSGHLPQLDQYVRAIAGGSTGSNDYVMSADDGNYENTLMIRWNGVEDAWVPVWTTTVNWANHTTKTAFRCVGPQVLNQNYKHTASAVFSGGRYQADSADNPGLGWVESNDACNARGGHVATSAELGELIQEGLPGGTSAPLYTSDQLGYNGANFLLAVLRWNGVDRRYAYFYNGNGNTTLVTWEYKVYQNAFRCVYYPVNDAYPAPQDAQCSGGCVELDIGGTGAKLWLDASDRQSVGLAAAYADCHASGAQLATERDYIESIRGGLANGTNNYLWTSDFGGGNMHIVKWTGAAPLYQNLTFADQYANDMTWAGLGESRPYRCAWTNEVR